MSCGGNIYSLEDRVGGNGMREVSCTINQEMFTGGCLSLIVTVSCGGNICSNSLVRIFLYVILCCLLFFLNLK